jgi:hypothetical protein
MVQSAVKRVLRALTVPAVAGMLMLGPTVANAHAAPVAKAASHASVSIRPPAGAALHVIKFYGRFQPAANGRNAAAARPAAATDCGDGYIEYYAIGNKEAMVFSGWELLGSYIGTNFFWNIAVGDNDGVGQKYFTGNPTQQGGGPQWWNIPTGWETYHSVTGPSFAELTEGIVQLAGGGTCVYTPGAAWTNLY